MKVPNPYRCDYCNTDKGETNHWWMRRREVYLFRLSPWDEVNAAQDEIGEYEHICSESCAAKALSKWMAIQAAPKVTGAVNA